jgi:hypothetical protein
LFNADVYTSSKNSPGAGNLDKNKVRITFTTGKIYATKGGTFAKHVPEKYGSFFFYEISSEI